MRWKLEGKVISNQLPFDPLNATPEEEAGMMKGYLALASRLVMRPVPRRLRSPSRTAGGCGRMIGPASLTMTNASWRRGCWRELSRSGAGKKKPARQAGRVGRTTAM